MKLPIGVAERLSLGLVVSPCDPTWAETAEPYRTHRPPPTAVHACRTAIVEPVEPATTVMTCLAEPVEKRSGNDPPACDGWLDLAEPLDRVELLTVAVGVGGIGSVAACATGCGCGWVDWTKGCPDVQAATATSTTARTNVRLRRRA